MIFIKKVVLTYIRIILAISDLLKSHVNFILNLRKKSENKENQFEIQIRKIWSSSKPEFGTIDTFYQSNPLLNIKGFRPTIARYIVYNLDKYVNKETNILDIGGNTGFFTSYVAQFAKHIDLVEFNDDLSKIAKLSIEQAKIKNVNIINMDIKMYEAQFRYDLIFSFAIHRWVGEPLELYLNRLLNLLDEKGKIIIESHPDLEDYIELEYEIKKNKNFKILNKGITDDHLGLIRYFYWLSKN
jgi:protein-L-isoaspartate O-methyltransferase